VLFDNENDSRLTGWEMLRESTGEIYNMAESKARSEIFGAIIIILKKEWLQGSAFCSFHGLMMHIYSLSPSCQGKKSRGLLRRLCGMPARAWICEPGNCADS